MAQQRNGFIDFAKIKNMCSNLTLTAIWQCRITSEGRSNRGLDVDSESMREAAQEERDGQINKRECKVFGTKSENRKRSKSVNN